MEFIIEHCDIVVKEQHNVAHGYLAIESGRRKLLNAQRPKPASVNNRRERMRRRSARKRADD
jgi:hypothetical protein